MSGRLHHWPEVAAFLTAAVGGTQSDVWRCSLPPGSGHETYVAQRGATTYFVKLGAAIDRYETLAAIGLTPAVVASGSLNDGTSIMVQEFVSARKPSRHDFHAHLDHVAHMLRVVHQHASLKQGLPPTADPSYRGAAERALADLLALWDRYRALVPNVADFVDQSLTRLAHEIAGWEGAGLVASHNDICNANWLIADDQRWYLIDLDTMALDDPARDVGALLWWYYPPASRRRFLTVAGYADDAGFRDRMRVRMSLHCLQIILPRANGFNTSDPSSFDAALTDFRAIVGGAENPQGYA